MIELKFDTKKYAAILEDEKGHIYAFERDSNPRWLNANDNTKFNCYRINPAGELDLSKIYEFKKSQLKDSLVEIKYLSK